MSDNMTIKLLSTQIPEYFELIKFATTTADEVDEKDLQPYLNELLHSLLSDKAQCWFSLDKDRNIKSVLLTRILMDKITTRKQLFIQTFYPFQMVSMDFFKELNSLLLEFAKKEQCQEITFDSPDEEIWKIAKSFGYQERNKGFIFKLER